MVETTQSHSASVDPRALGDPYATRQSVFIDLNAEHAQPRDIAWSSFHQRYAPIIAGFARNLGAKPQDIDDIIQTVMTGFFTASDRFVYDPAKGRFRGFLKTCTFRAVRRRCGESARLVSSASGELDPQSLAVEQAWNDVWEQEHLARALEETRQAYSNGKTFLAFEQYVIFAKPPEVVARELGMSVSSVYKAKERITAALRLKLQNLDEQGR
jgi:RNA polymerase sigma-70 factor (ECF subfamily)